MYVMYTGLSNFTDMDRLTRAKFCFEIFDDDRNGFITEEELINILMASHMVRFLGYL